MYSRSLKKMKSNQYLAPATAVFAGMVVASCGGGASTEQSAPGPQNRAPTIAGTAPDSVVQGASYSFIPTATDPDGDMLTFTVTGLPGWAAFDDSNGAVTGSPGMSDIGLHENISISVSDGQMNTNLAPFAIDVIASATGSLFLSWTPPVLNADGSALGDLAGYRIRWGVQSGVYTNLVDVNAAGISSYLLDNLPGGTYFIVVSAFDTSGNQSEFSNETMGSTN